MPQPTNENSQKSSLQEDGLASLRRRLYDQALVLSEQENITSPQGTPLSWMMDVRTPMLRGEIQQEVGRVLAERLRARKIHQVVGYGYGSFSVVCSVLSAPGSPPFRGGFVREARKKYGRHRLVEGPLDRSEPVALLDDILNSGTNAKKAISLLHRDGFHVSGFVTLFNFNWGRGRANLEACGIWVDSLVDLNPAPNRSESGHT